MRRITKMALILATLVPASALAQASPGKIQLKSVAEVEVEVTKPNGEVELRRAPAEKVVPGDDVIYTITATNMADVPVGDVAVTDPIPEHMDYRDGSATGAGTDIAFSVDGGKSWGAPETLRVVDNDGTVRPATTADYTHIRWQFTQELAPKESRSVRFRARLQ